MDDEKLRYVTKPTRTTLFLRTFLPWQAWRFAVINLKMIDISRRSHKRVGSDRQPRRERSRMSKLKTSPAATVWDRCYARSIRLPPASTPRGRRPG